MKEVLIKRLAELKSEKKKHEANLMNLTIAVEKCKTTINNFAGAIEFAEELLKDADKK